MKHSLHWRLFLVIPALIVTVTVAVALDYYGDDKMWVTLN